MYPYPTRFSVRRVQLFSIQDIEEMHVPPFEFWVPEGRIVKRSSGRVVASVAWTR